MTRRLHRTSHKSAPATTAATTTTTFNPTSNSLPKDTPAPQARNWFSTFSRFTYDATTGLQANFARLASQRKWGPRLQASRWAQCQEVEFSHAYGTDTSSLAKWQELCCDVGIAQPPPGSVGACKKALGSRDVLVNLVNLIDHRNLGVEVIRFKNYREFHQYTTDGRIFPLKRAKDDGFIKALLRKL